MTPADRDAMARRLQALRESVLEKTPDADRAEPHGRRHDRRRRRGRAGSERDASGPRVEPNAQGQAETLARIDRALARLASDPDLFGLCEECRGDRRSARLEALPDATLCTECQAKRDPQRNARRRSTSDFSR